jgi:hypothetical protein
MVQESAKAMEKCVEDFNKEVKGKTMYSSKGAVFVMIYYRTNPHNKKQKIPQEIAWHKITYIGKDNRGKNVIRSKRLKGRLQWDAMRSGNLIRNKEVLKDYDVRVAKLNEMMKKLFKTLSSIRMAMAFFQRNDAWTYEDLDKATKDPKRTGRTRRTKSELELEKERLEEERYMKETIQKQLEDNERRLHEEDEDELDEEDLNQMKEAMIQAGRIIYDDDE